MMHSKRIVGFLMLLVVFSCSLVACQAASSESTGPTVSIRTVKSIENENILTVGDIDPDKPARKVERFQPLAEYLAENLSEFGIKKGQVVIARDMQEMSRFMEDGTVDVYFDSPFPTLRVQSLAGSQTIARRWKQRAPTYWSTYVTLKGNGIDSTADFVGKIVAFEEPHSTSGFVLPAGTLIQMGFTLVEVSSPDATVRPDEIGYFFTRDEENTIELILQGRVAGGGISNQDLEELPTGLKERLTSFERTITVPRQLVSVRPGM